MRGGTYVRATRSREMEERIDFAIVIRRIEMERSVWRSLKICLLKFKLKLQKGGNVPAFIPPLPTSSPPK
jgi:hypothetical protein